MEWSQSYSSYWRVYRVNRRTWADAEQVANIDGASISRTADGELLESGSLKLTGELASDYYRIVMTAEQGGEVARVDVATLLFEASEGEVDYGVTEQDVDGYSVLYPASVATIIAGEYAPKGVNGAKYAADLLADAINAPVEYEGSFVLNEHIVHEIGTSVLEAVWSVLDAGGFVIQIDGRGVVYIRSAPEEPAYVFDNRNKGLLENGISYESDISEVPNRYIVIDGESKTVAVNNDSGSEVSYLNRGYYVDKVDESPTPINGETYGKYADRKLHDLSVLTDERSYAREYIPGINLYSIVRASIEGFEGDYRITSQSLECSNGITVKEKAEREIRLW